MRNSNIPKIIWILWLQGFEDAPDVVKRCLASWKKHNPTWKINLLDETNIKQFIDVHAIIGRNYKEISKQALSDVIRINLLSKFGGVWTDATCFCCKPLDEWLGSYIAPGFFAFRDPGNDRPISSWFLASGADSKLTQKYCETVNLFWSKNRFANQNTRIGKFAIKYIEPRIMLSSYRSIKFRILSFALKSLRVYPYFWFHYLFADIITKNKFYMELWETSKKYSSDVPHRLQISGLFKPLPVEIKNSIILREDPLYKLTCKFNEKEFVKGCTFDYLLEKA